MARLTDDSFIATYIIASGRNGTLYTGVSSDLPARIAQHKQELRPGFTTAYRCKRLVWYERHAFITEAIRRERAIKGWLRELKAQADRGPQSRLARPLRGLVRLTLSNLPSSSGLTRRSSPPAV